MTTSILDRVLNTDRNKLNEIEKKIELIENLSHKYKLMSDEELQDQTAIFKVRLQNNETLDDILPEAFATVREAAGRVIGEYPYHVQLIGGYILHNGDISEQATGSGKTLTAVLPTYLNALSGKGVHVVTVNEYLAERDAKKMGQIFEFLGLSVGYNSSKKLSDEKRKAYACDITYTSNAELGFDYLRDNLVMSKNDRVMRGLNYAIIDEIDSILIDEASTPLIISGKGKENKNLYLIANNAVKLLKENVDYQVDYSEDTCLLTNKGIHHLEKIFNIDNLYAFEQISLVHHIDQALKANYLMKRNKDYIVDNENQEILIVDPNTGRTLKGRQWSYGLHQAVEAKENIKIHDETKTAASITYQNLFRLYNKLSGMSATAKNEEDDFLKTYNMYVIQVPSNNPVKRIDYSDVCFNTMNEKYEAIVSEIINIHKTGRPILVGTVSIQSSEYLSSLLIKHGLEHVVLNAKNHKKEAQIIAHAGEFGAITIATNMAGRGTDIKLEDGVEEIGGLAVIGTERHTSKRIDDQLRGRSGRQGDSGSSKFFVSLDDDLIVQYGPECNKNKKKISDCFTTAQQKAEGLQFSSRQTLLEYDNIIRAQRDTIYDIRNNILDGNIQGYMDSIFSDLVKNTIENVLVESKSLKNIIIHTKQSQIISEKLNTIIGIAVFEEDEFIGMEKSKAIKYASRTLSNLLAIKVKGIEDTMNLVETSIALKIIDMEWTNHLSMMEELRTGIGLRAYAQNNPVQEYIEDGYKIFDKTIAAIEQKIIYQLLNIKIEY